MFLELCTGNTENKINAVHIICSEYLKIKSHYETKNLN